LQVGVLVGNASLISRLNESTYSLAGAARFDINLLASNGSTEDQGQAHLVAQVCSPETHLECTSLACWTGLPVATAGDPQSYLTLRFVLDAAMPHPAPAVDNLQDAIISCHVDQAYAGLPGNQPLPSQDARDKESIGGGTEGWVWAIVAVAAIAAVAVVLTALLMLHHRRRRQRAAARSGSRAARSSTVLEQSNSTPTHVARTHSPTDKDIVEDIVKVGVSNPNRQLSSLVARACVSISP
jgi:hypothetical protein